MDIEKLFRVETKLPKGYKLSDFDEYKTTNANDWEFHSYKTLDINGELWIRVGRLYRYFPDSVKQRYKNFMVVSNWKSIPAGLLIDWLCNNETYNYPLDDAITATYRKYKLPIGTLGGFVSTTYNRP